MAHKITKTFVDSIPFTSSGQMFYRDSELKGFALRVGTTGKVYIAEGKVKRKVVRVTIGKHGVFTAEQARLAARELLLMMAKGINPLDIEKEEKAKSVTLEQALADFLEARKALKPTTVYDYKKVVNTYLPDWKKKALMDITKDMVAKRHTQIGERSQAQANLVMRYLRAIFNFATAKYENSKGQPLFPDNPVKRLSQTRAWYRIERRLTVIKAHDLAPWYSAVMNIKNDDQSKNRETTRDYLLCILFTGLRRQEAASLRWANVDLRAKTLTVTDTKNRQDHTLPLSDFVFDLLQRRQSEAVNEYVFPNVTSTGKLHDPRKQMAHVINTSGVHFTIHDLRRTFITVAESLDISAYALKRLLNHKMSNDITAGYIITDVERLRTPMQRVTDQLLRYMGVKPSAEVVPFNPAALQTPALAPELRQQG
jgi:integrase